jgi:hypothetical protein
MEQAWVGLRSCGQVTGLRDLIREARHCYGEIHRYGHLSGVAAELSSRKGAAA